MTKRFCDCCGSEITEHNTVGDSNRLAAQIIKDGLVVLKVEVVTAKSTTWNDGDFCKYCVIDAIKKSDDRTTVRLSGQPSGFNSKRTDSVMDLNLKTDLYNSIQKWMDKNCESDVWPNIVIGDRTAEMMANAAESVFDACLESQQYGIRNGNFETA